MPDGAAALRFEVLEPAGWVGKPFPLLPHLTCTADLSSRQWVVVLHRPGCSSCRAIHTEFADLDLALGRRGDGRRVVFVEVPWADDKSGAPLKPHELYAVGRLNNDRKWFVETPVVLEVQNGTVTSVIEHPHPGASDRFRSTDP